MFDPSLLVHQGRSQGQIVSLTPELSEMWEWGLLSGSRCLWPHVERLLESRCLQEDRGRLPPAAPPSPCRLQLRDSTQAKHECASNSHSTSVPC